MLRGVSTPIDFVDARCGKHPFLPGFPKTHGEGPPALSLTGGTGPTGPAIDHSDGPNLWPGGHCF